MKFNWINIKGDECQPNIGESDGTTYPGDVRVASTAVIGNNVTIGDGAIIQHGAVIEDDCVIGARTRIGTNAVLRRETHIGSDSVFGSLSASEGKNWIGNHVLIHTQCHITTGAIIEDWVFIAPFFVGANDNDMLHGRRHIKEFVPNGPHIKFGARLGVGVTTNPGVVIGREAVVGSRSLVTKDVEDFTIVFGSPARLKGLVEPKLHLPIEEYMAFLERVSEEELKSIMEHMLADY